LQEPESACDEISEKSEDASPVTASESPAVAPGIIYMTLLYLVVTKNASEVLLMYIKEAQP